MNRSGPNANRSLARSKRDMIPETETRSYQIRNRLRNTPSSLFHTPSSVPTSRGLTLSPQINTLPSPALSYLEALPGLPFDNPSRQLGVTLITYECPALLVHVAISSAIGIHVGAVLDQGLGIFQIPIYSLDGGCYAIFLFHR